MSRQPFPYPVFVDDGTQDREMAAGSFCVQCCLNNFLGKNKKYKIFFNWVDLEMF